jgi:hypothetical protein
LFWHLAFLPQPLRRRGLLQRPFAARDIIGALTAAATITGICAVTTHRVIAALGDAVLGPQTLIEKLPWRKRYDWRLVAIAVIIAAAFATGLVVRVHFAKKKAGTSPTFLASVSTIIAGTSTTMI